MVRSFIRCVLILGIALCNLCTNPPPAAAQPVQGGAAPPSGMAAAAKIPEFDQAVACLRNGELDRGLEFFRAAVKKNPDLPSPRILMARWFGTTNQLPQMRSALEQATIETPQDPEPFALMGQLAVQNHQFTEATLLFGKVLELVKGGDASSGSQTAIRQQQVRRQAIENLAAIAESRKDWAGEQKYAEMFVLDDPKNIGALQQLARALFQQGKYDDAYANLKTAAAADDGKTMPSAEAVMASLYQQAGNLPKAATWMLQAIKEHPRDFRTRLVAADYSLAANNVKQATEQSDAALSLSPHSPEALTKRGMVALFAKDFEEAQNCLEKAHLLSPSLFAATNYLAFALCEQKDEAKRRTAVELAQFNARAFPDQPSEAFAMLGWTLYRSGQPAEAQAALQKSLSVGRPGPDAGYFMARMLADGGQRAEARSLAEHFLEPVLAGTAVFPTKEDAKALLTELKEAKK
ncbi:MAG: tetratricopeptide repeat protein [Thermoguttaceae bacterium]